MKCGKSSQVSLVKGKDQFFIEGPEDSDKMNSKRRLVRQKDGR
jgi:hypothetical protein